MSESTLGASFYFSHLVKDTTTSEIQGAYEFNKGILGDEHTSSRTYFYLVWITSEPIMCVLLVPGAMQDA